MKHPDADPASPMSLPSIPGTLPVSFHLSPARHGWISLVVQAGEKACEEISCSNVYDPFKEITEAFTMVVWSQPIHVEIDEEGRSTMIRLDVEPGSLVGRLRVYDPDVSGGIELLHLDAPVDVVQTMAAWHGALDAHADVYDPEHWEPLDESDHKRLHTTSPRPLARLDRLRSTLIDFGAVEGTADEIAALQDGAWGRTVDNAARYRALLEGRPIEKPDFGVDMPTMTQ